MINVWVCLALIVTICPTYAFGAEPVVTEITEKLSDENVERVKSEVLSGEITNHENVIALAIQQYENRVSNASVNTCADSEMDASDDSLTISQMIHTDDPESEMLAISALMVTDQSGNVAEASAVYRHYLQSSGSISEYQVYAVHTLYAYVQGDTDSFPLNVQYKVAKMTTKITYGLSLTMTTTLIQKYEPCDLQILDGEYEHTSSTVTNPTNGKNYTFTPSGTDWFTAASGRSVKTQAIITCGSKMLKVGILLQGAVSFNGDW